MDYYFWGIQRGIEMAFAERHEPHAEKVASQMSSAIARVAKPRSLNVASIRPSGFSGASTATRSVPAPGTNRAGMGAHTRNNPVQRTGSGPLPGQTLTSQATQQATIPQIAPKTPLSTASG